MAKLSNEWWDAFNGCFQTEEDVIAFIFENIDIKEWQTSYKDLVGYNEPMKIKKKYYIIL